MPEITLNGPVVKEGVHNLMLREAKFHSPVERLDSSTNYHVISIGIREAADGSGDYYTDWIGTWDQRTQTVGAAEPVSVLDETRVDFRLKAKQAVVVKIETTGAPESLAGSRVNFRLARVGGVDGPAKPLIAPGVEVAEANTKVTLAVLERQINETLSEWEESVQLKDPVSLVGVGTFQGRLVLDSATQISLQRHSGNWVEVDGEAVSLGADGLTVAASDNLLSASGGIGSSTPSASTLYYVYVGTEGEAQIRLSATAPSLHGGVYYLGTTEGATSWRFCGYAYLNSSTQFTDSETSRCLVNYYNRLWKTLYTCPGYVDDNAVTSYTTASTTWLAANGGTGSQVVFVSNGEDAVVLHATAYVANSAANYTRAGISVDSTTDCLRAGSFSGTTAKNIHVDYRTVFSAGRHTADLVICVSAGTGTYYADSTRQGATADPATTYLAGEIQA